MTHDLKCGDPLYVPSGDIAVAMSLGASLVEGDARLRIPTPLPGGVPLEAFEKWVTPEARMRWLSEFVEMVAGSGVDLLSLTEETIEAQTEDVVRLYVPKPEMEKARLIPGVRWSRSIGMYVADRSASFDLIFPFLTESMKASWLVDRNVETEMSLLIKSRALVARSEVEGDRDIPQRELDWPEEEVEEGSDEKNR